MGSRQRLNDIHIEPPKIKLGDTEVNRVEVKQKHWGL